MARVNPIHSKFKDPNRRDYEISKMTPEERARYEWEAAQPASEADLRDYAHRIGERGYVHRRVPSQAVDLNPLVQPRNQGPAILDPGIVRAYGADRAVGQAAATDLKQEANTIADGLNRSFTSRKAGQEIDKDSTGKQYRAYELDEIEIPIAEKLASGEYSIGDRSVEEAIEGYKLDELLRTVRDERSDEIAQLVADEIYSNSPNTRPVRTVAENTINSQKALAILNEMNGKLKAASASAAPMRAKIAEAHADTLKQARIERNAAADLSRADSKLVDLLSTEISEGNNQNLNRMFDDIIQKKESGIPLSEPDTAIIKHYVDSFKALDPTIHRELRDDLKPILEPNGWAEAAGATQLSTSQLAPDDYSWASKISDANDRTALSDIGVVLNPGTRVPASQGLADPQGFLVQGNATPSSIVYAVPQRAAYSGEDIMHDTPFEGIGGFNYEAMTRAAVPEVDEFFLTVRNPDKRSAIANSLQRIPQDSPQPHRPSGDVIDDNMLITDQNTGEIFRRGGGRPTAAQEMVRMHDIVDSYGGIDAINQKIKAHNASRAQQRPPSVTSGRVERPKVVVTGGNTGPRGGDLIVRDNFAGSRSSSQDGMGARLRGAAKATTDKLGQADDAIQSFIREKVIGFPADGNRGETGASRTARTILGAPFRARPGSASDTEFRFTDDQAGRAAMIASRALQAGIVTAAGANMINLTDQLMEQYGGPGDQPDPSTMTF